MLRIQIVLHFLVDRHGARKLERGHRGPDEFLIAEHRMVFPQIVRGHEMVRVILVVHSRGREPLQKQRVRLVEQEAHAKIARLFHATEGSARPQETRLRAEVAHLVFIPVDEVVARERLSVRPPHAPAQRKGENTEVRRDLPALREVGHQRIPLRRPAHEARARHPPIDRAHVRDRIHEPIPRAAVTADPVDSLQHHRLRPDPLGDRREPTLAHQLRQHRSLGHQAPPAPAE